MIRIFLLTVSDQSNACNLILRFMHKKFQVHQTQRRQPKTKAILFHTATTTYTTQFYESYIPNNKPNKHNPNNQNNGINVDFNTKFVLLQLRQRKFWSIHIQISTKFKTIHIQPISYISSITNLYISSIPKNLFVA